MHTIKQALICSAMLSLLSLLLGCSMSPGDKGEPYTPVLTTGEAGEWDAHFVMSPFVYFDAEKDLYIMYYSGSQDNNERYRIGYAESTDGKVWVKRILDSVDNICINYGDLGSWNERGVFGACVVKENSTTYHMWYTGFNNSLNYQIGYASSEDGEIWTTEPDPVLSPSGIADAFDKNHIWDLDVLRSEGIYHMWYSGQNSSGEFSIGYTSTLDPRTIPNASEPIAVLVPTQGSHFSVGTLAPSVLFDTSDLKYKMWCTAMSNTNTVAMAQSASMNDGWEIWAGPVLTAHTTGFDAAWVGLCSVIKDPLGTGFKMWYTGSSSSMVIGYAESDDGVSWVKYRAE